MDRTMSIYYKHSDTVHIKSVAGNCILIEDGPF